MYLAEIADQKIRGSLTGLNSVMFFIGIILVYVLVPFTPFYIPSLFAGLLFVGQMIFLPFMPKSPYYLLAKNEVDSAKQCLNRLRATSNNDNELEEMRKAVERQKKEKGRPQDLFLIPSNRKAVIISAFLSAAQPFCGFWVMLMNMHMILTEAGSLYFTPNTAATLFASCMLVSAIISSVTVDRCGRKFLLITSTLLTSVCFLCLAVYFHLLLANYDLKGVNWIPVACVMAYAAVYEIGIGAIPSIISAELYPNRVKAMGMTLSDTILVVSGLLSVEIYKILCDNYGYHVPFYLFSLFAIVTAIFCRTVVPETKGRTLEEIQLALKGQLLNADDEEDITQQLSSRTI